MESVYSSVGLIPYITQIRFVFKWLTKIGEIRLLGEREREIMLFKVREKEKDGR